METKLQRKQLPYLSQVSGRRKGISDVPHEETTRIEENTMGKAIKDVGIRKLNILEEGSDND